MKHFLSVRPHSKKQFTFHSQLSKTIRNDKRETDEIASQSQPTTYQNKRAEWNSCCHPQIEQKREKGRWSNEKFYHEKKKNICDEKHNNSNIYKLLEYRRMSLSFEIISNW